jgi:hypothetical protein
LQAVVVAELAVVVVLVVTELQLAHQVVALQQKQEQRLFLIHLIQLQLVPAVPAVLQTKDSLAHQVLLAL